MPLVFKKDFYPDIKLGVWRMDEDIEFFESNLDLYEEELDEIEPLTSKKKFEWLCSRYLLHILSGRKLRGPCIKDQYGKPYLKDSEYYISISHSFNMCAVIASKNSIGVDIQKLVTKIERIKDKFIRSDENTAQQSEHHLEKLHIYWGAKESIYKAYGKKNLNFKDHMKILDFEYKHLEYSNISGILRTKDFSNNYEGKAFMIEEFMLCYLC